MGNSDDKTTKNYTPICARREVATLWECKPQNIGETYANNPQKQTQYQMLDMGAFCVINNIDGEMLELLVRFGNEFKNRFHDMSEAEIEEFQEFKKFKLFQSREK